MKHCQESKLAFQFFFTKAMCGIHHQLCDAGDHAYGSAVYLCFFQFFQLSMIRFKYQFDGFQSIHSVNSCPCQNNKNQNRSIPSKLFWHHNFSSICVLIRLRFYRFQSGTFSNLQPRFPKTFSISIWYVFKFSSYNLNVVNLNAHQIHIVPFQSSQNLEIFFKFNQIIKLVQAQQLNQKQQLLNIYTK